MRPKMKTLFPTAAVLAALMAGPILYAHADTTDSEGQGGMMQEGQGGMMSMMTMMQQMSSMMETCNEMMQGMTHHDPENPDEDNSSLESEG